MISLDLYFASNSNKHFTRFGTNRALTIISRKILDPWYCVWDYLYDFEIGWRIRIKIVDPQAKYPSSIQTLNFELMALRFRDILAVRGHALFWIGSEAHTLSASQVMCTMPHLILDHMGLRVIGGDGNVYAVNRIISAHSTVAEGYSWWWRCCVILWKKNEGGKLYDLILSLGKPECI